MKVALCDPYAWEDPGNFFRNMWSKVLNDASKKSCMSELVNQVFFVYLLSVIIGFLLAVCFSYPLAIFVSIAFGTALLIPTFRALYLLPQYQGKEMEEGFDDMPYNGPTGIVECAPDLAEEVTYPTPQNPFMNLLVSEIKTNPMKPPAAAINDPVVQGGLDEAFRIQVYSDPTDVFGKSQSQRQFVTMPVTTVPNDQGSFADWLYRIPGKTCKEGGRRACMPGTDGSPVTWLNVSP